MRLAAKICVLDKKDSTNLKITVESTKDKVQKDVTKNVRVKEQSDKGGVLKDSANSATAINVEEIELPPSGANTSKSDPTKDKDILSTIPIPEDKKSVKSKEGHDLKTKTVPKPSGTDSIGDIDLASIPKPEMPPAKSSKASKIPLPGSKSKKSSGISQSRLQATLRESMLKEVQKDNCDMPQNIVDDMFKDFLASKMQQIEEEYKKMSERIAAGSKSGEAVDIASSVDEMNKLLDEELDSISQNTNCDAKSSSEKRSKWDVKTKGEFSEKTSTGSEYKQDSEKPKVEVKLGTKGSGKMQLQFKISQTSAEIISSGQQFDKEGNKKKLLEEGRFKLYNVCKPRCTGRIPRA